MKEITTYCWNCGSETLQAVYYVDEKKIKSTCDVCMMCNSSGKQKQATLNELEDWERINDAV